MRGCRCGRCCCEWGRERECECVAECACACVCALERLGRDLNIYELCSKLARGVYLPLCSSPPSLPRPHTYIHFKKSIKLETLPNSSFLGADFFFFSFFIETSCTDEARSTGKCRFFFFFLLFLLSSSVLSLLQ